MDDEGAINFALGLSRVAVLLEFTILAVSVLQFLLNPESLYGKCKQKKLKSVGLR